MSGKAKIATKEERKSEEVGAVDRSDGNDAMQLAMQTEAAPGIIGFTLRVIEANVSSGGSLAGSGWLLLLEKSERETRNFAIKIMPHRRGDWHIYSSSFSRMCRRNMGLKKSMSENLRDVVVHGVGLIGMNG